MALRFTAPQFEQLSWRRFERRLVDLLAAGDPAAATELAGDEALAALRQQCERAQGWGMTSELDIARYVICAWLLGADFDTRVPAVREVLATGRLNPSQKSEALERICAAAFAQLNPEGS